MYKKIFVVVLLTMITGTAYAHPGHAELSGFISGIAHPLLGLDHLLAMIAVGIWAAQLRGRNMWMMPAVFISVMIIGATLAIVGINFPMVENGIALSVLLLGLLVGFAFKMHVALSALCIGTFALFHGYAHGTELPVAASPWLYASGFVLATALLHGCGILLGNHLQKLARIAGVMIAMAGAALLLNAL